MNDRTGNKFYERKFFHELIILLVPLPTELSYLQLDLSYNALSFLDEDLTHWESLESANLQGNPWDCTCRLQWVLDKVLPLIYNTSQDLLYELRLVRILYCRSFEEKTLNQVFTLLSSEFVKIEACPESKDTKVLNMYNIFNLQKRHCE